MLDHWLRDGLLHNGLGGLRDGLRDDDLLLVLDLLRHIGRLDVGLLVLRRLLDYVLFFDCVVFSAFLYSFNWDVFYDSGKRSTDLLFLDDLWDVLNLVLDCVVVSDLLGNRDLDLASHFFVFGNSSLVGDVLDTGLAFDGRLLSDNLFANLGSLWGEWLPLSVGGGLSVLGGEVVGVVSGDS